MPPKNRNRGTRSKNSKGVAKPSKTAEVISSSDAAEPDIEYCDDTKEVDDGTDKSTKISMDQTGYLKPTVDDVVFDKEYTENSIFIAQIAGSNHPFDSESNSVPCFSTSYAAHLSAIQSETTHFLYCPMAWMEEDGKSYAETIKRIELESAKSKQSYAAVILAAAGDTIDDGKEDVQMAPSKAVNYQPTYADIIKLTENEVLASAASYGASGSSELSLSYARYIANTEASLQEVKKRLPVISLVSTKPADPLLQSFPAPKKSTGWLLKQSAWLGFWRKRYFQLSDIGLEFSSAESVSPHGVIVINNATEVIRLPTFRTGKPHSFLVVSAKETFTLQAATEEEVDAWVLAIEQAKSELDPSNASLTTEGELEYAAC